MLCNLSLKSCFLFLYWGSYIILSSFFTLPVCFLLFPCLFGISVAATPGLVLSWRRPSRTFDCVLASLVRCAQSGLQHVLFSEILGWGSVKCDPSILLIIFFYCGLLKEEPIDGHHYIWIVDGQGNWVCMPSQNHTVRIRKALCPMLCLDSYFEFLLCLGGAVGQVGILHLALI